MDKILKPCTKRHGIPQVVIPAEKIPEKVPLLSLPYPLDIQRAKLLHTAGKHAIGCVACYLFLELLRTCIAFMLFLGKLKGPFVFETFQQVLAFPGLQTAIGSFPLQEFTYRVGKLGAADAAA